MLSATFHRRAPLLPGVGTAHAAAIFVGIAPSASRMKAWRIGVIVAVAATALGCSEDTSVDVPAPVAGLEHVEVARVGDVVRFSAAPTAVAAVDKGVAAAAGTRIVRFEFAVADGSARVETAASTIDHVFAAAGSYGVTLSVVDDAGRRSSVSSVITIAVDLTATCSAATIAECSSGRCAAGACVLVACAGDPACPAHLGCNGGYCSGGEASGGDVRYGHDGARTALDANP